MLKKDLAAINAIAFLNKTNVKSATPIIVNERADDIERMWTAITMLPAFGKKGAKTNTVVAQPVVMKALAKLTFDLLFSNRRPENGAELFAHLVDNLETIDFSHGNPMWRYYQLKDAEKADPELAGLADYLPNRGVETAESNRDVGGFQGGVMRFGAKHNDIFPILTDMIRWKMKLPNRHAAGVPADDVEEG
jgi:hypothetical protein